MAELNADHFAEFYQAMWNYPPFPWQQRLLEQVLEDGWPSTIDLPTASGKTACLDIALFAMAVRETGPRRIFFVVDRRVVVDAAFERMKNLACKLKTAKAGVLKVTADRLRQIASGGKVEADVDPLTTYQLRGGIYRDNDWIRSPLQPMLIASTVDQVGSRLLFRGYGLSQSVCPIHAGLVSNDALLLLDEAHYSVPFAKTLRAIQRYNGPQWTAEQVSTPLQFVEMTATPGAPNGAPFRLDPIADYQNLVMSKRLFARKSAKLAVSKSTVKNLGKFASDLADEALRMAAVPGIRRIAIMVNRVQTAREVFKRLEKKRAHLLIGRMRPIDRLSLDPAIDAMLSGKQQRNPEGEPVFVVATQCLEVGADLDFDALVTECASIEALQQRFGRLDRTGELTESKVVPEACVMIQAPMTESKYEDAIYGGALSATWNWLSEIGNPVEFGIASADGSGSTVRERLDQLSSEEVSLLRRASPPSPALLPAHLDLFVQTSPLPTPDPDPHLFLHGKETGSADVQVVWRADLNVADQLGCDLSDWIDIVSACPPTSLEAMTVPWRGFMAWWTNTDAPYNSADLEGVQEQQEEKRKTSEEVRPVRILRWAGEDSEFLDSSRGRPRPGDTLILPASAEGWDELGHKPPKSPADVAEWARLEMRRPWILRLHPAVMQAQDWPEAAAKLALIKAVAGEDQDLIIPLLEEYARQIPKGWLKQVLAAMPTKRRLLNEYPGGLSGWIVSGSSAEADSGADESSSGGRVALDVHLKDVRREVSRFASALLGQKPELVSHCEDAAPLHDLGKADPRFQVVLHGGDEFAAKFSPTLLAKGDQTRLSKKARRLLRERIGLPESFRHELCSLMLLGPDAENHFDDLVLHLVASHHGRCRPFAPVVLDEDGPEFVHGERQVTRGNRTNQAAHRIDSGVPDRFWRLTRKFGWWGLAYLETLFRLGDWSASKAEQEEFNQRVNLGRKAAS